MTSDLDLTVEENLNIYAKLYDVPAKRRKEAIDELLETVDLTKWRHAQTKTLSGGMRRRLEIARGLVHSPKFSFSTNLLLDWIGVARGGVGDADQHQVESQTHGADHHALHGRSDRLCNRIAIVDHGKLVALDTPEALKASVPGSTVIEVQFDNLPADWEQRLRALPK